MVPFRRLWLTILPGWLKRFWYVLLSLQPGPPAPSHPERDTSRPETDDRSETPRFPLFDREPFRPVTEFFPDPANNVVVNGAIGPSSPTQKTSSETETPTPFPLPTSPLDASGPGESIRSHTLKAWWCLKFSRLGSWTSCLRLHPQRTVAVTPWIRDLAETTWWGGTTMPPPTPAPSSGSEAV